MEAGRMLKVKRGIIKTGLFLFLCAGAIFCSLCFEMQVQAAETKDSEAQTQAERSYIDDWLSTYDMSDINQGMDNLFPEMNIDADELLFMIMEGKFLEAFTMLTGWIREWKESGEFLFIFLYWEWCLPCFPAFQICL